MSDVFLTPEQLLLREQYRELAKNEIMPYVKDIDEKDVIPQELVARLAGDPFRLPALSVPKEYGGLGLSVLDVCVIAEEIGAVCPALIPFMEIAQLYAHVIKYGGTEEQNQRFLSQLAEGKLGCYALTDDGPGSDPAAMTTSVEKTDQGYVMSGRKRIITFADMADLFAIFGKMGGPSGGSKTITAFIVEKGAEGLILEKHCEAMGLKGHRAYNLIFDNLQIPEENRIGEEGEGLSLALTVLNTTRISLACGFVGLARASLDAAISFAKQRLVGGKPIAEQEGISFPIAEVATEIDAARLLAYRAAKMEE